MKWAGLRVPVTQCIKHIKVIDRKLKKRREDADET